MTKLTTKQKLASLTSLIEGSGLLNNGLTAKKPLFLPRANKSYDFRVKSAGYILLNISSKVHRCTIVIKYKRRVKM